MYIYIYILYIYVHICMYIYVYVYGLYIHVHGYIIYVSYIHLIERNSGYICDTTEWMNLIEQINLILNKSIWSSSTLVKKKTIKDYTQPAVVFCFNLPFVIQYLDSPDCIPYCLYWKNKKPTQKFFSIFFRFYSILFCYYLWYVCQSLSLFYRKKRVKNNHNYLTLFQAK